MKISIRLLLVCLPILAVCALLVGLLATHTMGTSAHAMYPNTIPEQITDSAVNLYKCDNGPQSNCSVLTQLDEGDSVQVQCQIGSPNAGWWSYVTAPDYGDTGWVSNNYISGGPNSIFRVPTCSTKH